jgi:hypothetical protein
VLRRLVARLPKAPTPEYADIVWAARGRAARKETPVIVALTYLLELLLLVAVFAVVPLGWQFGLALWLLAGVCDWLAARQDTNISRLLSHVGFRPNVRALIRSIIALVPFSALFDDWPPQFQISLLLTYVILVVVTQLVWASLLVMVNFLSISAPPLVYHPVGEQGKCFTDHAYVYRTGVCLPVVFLISEALFLVTWQIFFSTGAPLGWLWAVEAVTPLYLLIAVGYGLWMLFKVRRLHRQAPAQEGQLLEGLRALHPEYLVYISLGQGQSNYIANQWLPVFDKIPQHGFILIREASQLPPLGKTNLPVVYAPNQRHVEALSLPTVKVALYPAFGDRNPHLLRDISVKHVMILHGDSDKASSFNATTRAYDQIWVAGEAGMERYWRAGIDIPREKFAIVGRPQTEGLNIGPLRQEPKVVLYAPTFEGYIDRNNYTSLLQMGPALIEWLIQNRPELRLWFKPHPSTGNLQPQMLVSRTDIERRLAATGNRSFIDRTYPINQCFMATDVLIADVSAVVTDFLYTERPIIVCDINGVGEAEFRELYPSLASAYVLKPDLSNIAEVMDLALGDDPLAPARKAAKTYLLGDLPDGPQAAFNAAMSALIEKASG